MPFRIHNIVQEVVKEVIQEVVQEAKEVAQPIAAELFDDLVKEHDQIKRAYIDEIDKIKSLIEQKLSAPSLLSPRKIDLQKQIDQKEKQIKELEEPIPQLVKPPLVKKKGIKDVTKSKVQSEQVPKWR